MLSYAFHILTFFSRANSLLCGSKSAYRGMSRKAFSMACLLLERQVLFLGYLQNAQLRRVTSGLSRYRFARSRPQNFKCTISSSTSGSYIHWKLHQTQLSIAIFRDIASPSSQSFFLGSKTQQSAVISTKACYNMLCWKAIHQCYAS